MRFLPTWWALGSNAVCWGLTHYAWFGVTDIDVDIDVDVAR